MTLLTKLYPYQARGVKWIEYFGGTCLLADEMGLGKSIQALVYASKNPELSPYVVVCPASLKYNWEREAKQHCDMNSIVLSGMKVPRVGMLPHHKLLIINYDILGPWLEFFKAIRPGLVILDECHMLGNMRTKRTQNARTLCKGVSSVIALSGTPLTNRPSELWPTLNILRPDLYPNFYEFAVKHCKPKRTPWGWQYKGATRLDELHHNLKKHLMIRRLKKDVLSELPAKTRTVIPVDIDNRKEYDEAEQDFLHWLRKVAPKKATKAAKAEKLVKMGYLKRLAGRLKLRQVTQWIDEFLHETDEKLIVFAVHKVVVSEITTRYGSICSKVDGSITGKKREEQFERFKKDPKCRLFVGNIDAAGTGWNGTVASKVLFAELSWTPGKHTQAEDRIHRIGQLRAGIIYYLIAKNTIEEHLAKIIQEKQRVLDACLDGQQMNESIDIYDELALRMSGKLPELESVIPVKKEDFITRLLRKVF